MRTQPRYISGGSNNVVLSTAPCIIGGAKVITRTTSTRLVFYDATGVGSLNATLDIRLELFAGASGSDELSYQMQFNTGCVVSCMGAGVGSVGFIGKT